MIAALTTRRVVLQSAGTAHDLFRPTIARHLSANLLRSLVEKGL
ncbi:hypothetical protein Pr1d_00770 [Bythopirellula goksoeyrii]|uniref:Uncharacterized protein n=1 Tax=Bythopirellula goksoeyrii TaxID=1400387 RepID=A0A5B9Q192_9BACT|nr:hypothetical protein Pr1d_00770 [Bythopirellula goksoeyrii]